MGQANGKPAGPRRSGDDDSAGMLRLSIIIPALNESACIAAALASARLAVVAPVDVVVVDGGSTDDTVQVAQQGGAKVIRAGCGRGRQLNAGWRATRGEWCLFLHSDSQLPPRYDERIAASLRAAQKSQQQRRRAHWALRRVHAAFAESGPAGPATALGACSPALAVAEANTSATITAITAFSASQAPRRGCPGWCPLDGVSTTTPVEASSVTAEPKASTGARSGQIDGSGCGSGWDGDAGVRVTGKGRCRGSSGCSRSFVDPCCIGTCPFQGHGGTFGAARWAGRTAVLDCGWAGGGGSNMAAVPPLQPTWGAFATIHTDLRNPLLRTLLSTGVELRTRLLHRPYGDQALFVRRDVLEACGGFVEWPLLEDLQLVQRLCREQPPVLVDAPITTSGRRWQSVGFLRTTLLNQAILVAYAVGFPPELLAGWYRNTKRAV